MKLPWSLQITYNLFMCNETGNNLNLLIYNKNLRVQREIRRCALMRTNKAGVPHQQIRQNVYWREIVLQFERDRRWLEKKGLILEASIPSQNKQSNPITEKVFSPTIFNKYYNYYNVKTSLLSLVTLVS